MTSSHTNEATHHTHTHRRGVVAPVSKVRALSKSSLCSHLDIDVTNCMNVNTYRFEKVYVLRDNCPREASTCPFAHSFSELCPAQCISGRDCRESSCPYAHNHTPEPTEAFIWQFAMIRWLRRQNKDRKRLRPGVEDVILGRHLHKHSRYHTKEYDGNIGKILNYYDSVDESRRRRVRSPRHEPNYEPRRRRSISRSPGRERPTGLRYELPERRAQAGPAPSVTPVTKVDQVMLDYIRSMLESDPSITQTFANLMEADRRAKA